MNNKFKLSIILLTLLTFTIGFNSCSKEEEATPAPAPVVKVLPVANFSYSNADNAAPIEVTFTNSSTNGKTYAWDFGDGTTSTEENPKHTYTNTTGNVMSRTISLTATNDDGSDIITKTVSIQPMATPATKTELLTAPLWKATAMVLYDINYYSTTDYYAYLHNNGEDCYLDNIRKFTKTAEGQGNYQEDEGATKCDPSDPQISYTDTWLFNASETIISFNGGYDEWNIETLTATTLKINYVENDGVDSYRYTITYAAQ